MSTSITEESTAMKNYRLAISAVFCLLSLTVFPCAAFGQLNCNRVNLPVALVDGGPQSYNVVGEFCYSGTQVPSVVQLLVHGGTYNRLYWDFPYNSPQYSYANSATQAGYATLAVDRIGDGESSRPPSALVDLNAGAVALHQVIQHLRSGDVGGHAFNKVIYVGHSIGSLLAWLEVATYHDVDGVILSGALHKFSQTFFSQAVTDLYPADLDPHFAGLNLDSGYITSVPGTRGFLFYYTPGADPNVIATDEANKDTMTSLELTGATSYWAGGPPAQSPSLQITVPVLLVIGQEDNIFCKPDAIDCSSAQSVLQAEGPYYSPQALLQVVVVPNCGHDINLHYTGSLFYNSALSWSEQYFPLN
jgi:pimeloyl-ACP methyl ester carboxylesterase